MTAVLLEELFGHARIDSVRSLRRAVARIAIREGADREVVSDVTLCVHEALANVVRHAYGDYPGPVEVRVVRTPNELIVVVRDMGKGLLAQGAGTFGYGLKFIDRLARRSSLAASRGGGTEVRMSFPLSGRPRGRHGGLRAAAHPGSFRRATEVRAALESGPRLRLPRYIGRPPKGASEGLNSRSTMNSLARTLAHADR